MSDIIQLLPDHVANQIAAGEVVQRPASVVKELLENAIDAGATTIKLIIKNAGKTLIQVIDDGKGMSETDARLCFERHATSKIKSAEDLFALNTKGFRGEALASIAAIAHVTLKTKQNYTELGTEITIEGSQVISQQSTVTPNGTSVAVKNLFFNIPARRNFLKSEVVELRHITDEFHRVALSHPSIAFVFYNNGSELFNLPSENYRLRIVHIFGSKTNEKLVPVNEITEVVKISGFVGKPQFAKKSRTEQFFFVNDRFIKSPYLNHALSTAFEGLLKPGLFPSYFLYLQVNPEHIDINIHPTKTEIKFDDEPTIFAILKASVKHSLGQFNIAPALDFEHQEVFNTPYNYKNKSIATPSITVDKDFNPFKFEQQSSNFKTKKNNRAHWESLYVDLEPQTIDKINTERSFEVESNPENKQLIDYEAIQTQKNTFQLHNKYIVTTVKSGLLVINQNRAHQRILYENYLKQMSLKAATTQQLLFPTEIDLTSSTYTHFNTIKPDLEHVGFVFSEITTQKLKITGVPLEVETKDLPAIFDQLFADLINEVPNNSFSTTDALAKSLAKSTAIKTGQTLSITEQEHLINSLFGCKEPSIAPNNTLAFITLETQTIEKQFL